MEIGVGFQALVNRYDARRNWLTYTGLDRGRALKALEDFHDRGTSVVTGAREALEDPGAPWGAEAAEVVLIRMVVLAGFVVANASSAGQWESMYADPRNVLAAAAVINDDRLRCPVRGAAGVVPPEGSAVAGRVAGDVDLRAWPAGRLAHTRDVACTARAGTVPVDTHPTTRRSSMLNETDDDPRVAALCDLGGMDPATKNVVVLAEHRQSCDGPSVSGPFATAAAARDFAVAQYLAGEFDLDGCTVQYRVARI